MYMHCTNMIQRSISHPLVFLSLPLCHHHPQHVADLLIQDLHSATLSLPTCTALQADLARLTEDKPPEPLSKRVKLEPNSSDFSSMSAPSQVAVCNAVRAVMDGQPVRPPFWKLFSSSELNPVLYQFLFHVSTKYQIQYECAHHQVLSSMCMCV